MTRCSHALRIGQVGNDATFTFNPIIVKDFLNGVGTFRGFLTAEHDSTHKHSVFNLYEPFSSN